jgi:DNA-binding beta-propeller fold protein YncE
VLLSALYLLSASASAQLATTGDLLVVDASVDTVFVVDLLSGQQSVLAAGPPLSDPSDVKVEPTSNLVYVTDRSGGPGGTGAPGTRLMCLV